MEHVRPARTPASACWLMSRSRSDGCRWPAPRRRSWKPATARRSSCCTAGSSAAGVLGAGDRRLAESHRVIAPDLPGLGESEPVARLDAEAFAGLVHRLLPRDVRGEADADRAFPERERRRALRGRVMVISSASLVIYAAPAIGSYRMPLGLRVVAIRFGLRPRERNAERFDRWAFFDFDEARRRDPEWFEAFSDYTRAARRPARQADHGAAAQDRHEADPRRRAPPHRGPDDSAVGSA